MIFFRRVSPAPISNSEAMIIKYLKETKSRKLHLGCGENIIPTWLNSDLNEGEGRISLDVTHAFPLPSSSFSCVYSEHLIEHVSYPDGQKMLTECFRIMKKGSRVRIATPNLAFLIGIYQNPTFPLYRRYLRWAIKNFSPHATRNYPGFLLNNFVRAWGHQFVYDQNTLSLALKQAGFVQVKSCQMYRSVDPNLVNLEFHARDLGDDFYGLETLILEAVKP